MPSEKSAESFQQPEVSVRIGFESLRLELDEEVEVALVRIVLIR